MRSYVGVLYERNAHLAILPSEKYYYGLSDGFWHFENTELVENFIKGISA
jgi:hypothetical protein